MDFDFFNKMTFPLYSIVCHRTFPYRGCRSRFTFSDHLSLGLPGGFFTFGFLWWTFCDTPIWHPCEVPDPTNTFGLLIPDWFLLYWKSRTLVSSNHNSKNLLVIQRAILHSRYHFSVILQISNQITIFKKYLNIILASLTI